MSIRTNKADHPRERLMLQMVPLPTQPAGIEPLVVMMRTDGVHIVYDPARELGKRTVFQGAYGAACEAAKETRCNVTKD